MIALATNAQMQGTTVPTTGLHWITHGYCIPAVFLHNISTSLMPAVNAGNLTFTERDNYGARFGLLTSQNNDGN